MKRENVDFFVKFFPPAVLASLMVVSYTSGYSMSLSLNVTAHDNFTLFNSFTVGSGVRFGF